MDRWTAAFVACLTIAVIATPFASSSAFEKRDLEVSAWGSLAKPTPVTP